MSQSREKLVTDGQTAGQRLIYRTMVPFFLQLGPEIWHDVTIPQTEP